MNITLRQLHIFREVAESGSFTRASKQLFLSQPAVSMQIKQLEQTVGQPLLVKLGRGLMLTDAGQEMLTLSRSMLDQVHMTAERLQLISEGQIGRLNLVVASTVSSVATRLLAHFKADYPAVQISFEVTNREGLIQRLGDNQADIVLMGQPPERLPIKAVAFMGNPLVTIAAPDHPLVRRKRRASLKKLIKHGFVVREPGSGTRMAMERLFSERGFQLEASMEMNSNEAIKQAVEAGLGLGVVSLHTLAHELREKRLAIVEAEGFPILRSWFLVQRRDKLLSPLAMQFRRYVLQQASLMGDNPAESGIFNASLTG
jgi:DNA-binding transcriptional LysR family regulator